MGDLLCGISDLMSSSTMADVDCDASSAYPASSAPSADSGSRRRSVRVKRRNDDDGQGATVAKGAVAADGQDGGCGYWDTIKFLTEGSDSEKAKDAAGAAADSNNNAGSGESADGDSTSGGGSASSSSTTSQDADDGSAATAATEAEARARLRFVGNHAYKWFCMDTKLSVLRSIPETSTEITTDEVTGRETTVEVAAEAPTYLDVIREVNVRWKAADEATRRHYEQIAEYEYETRVRSQ